MMEMTGTAAAGGGVGSVCGVRERGEGDDGLGLGLVVPQKVARAEAYPFRFPSNSSVGPTFCNGSDGRWSDLYDVGGMAAAAAAVAAAGGPRTLQPFPFKSPGVGGMMAASLRFPFTWAQWQELERQALIYKYMMASVPVPPDLLIPINSRGSSTFSAAAAAAAHPSLVGRGGGAGSCFNLRFSSNSTDPEPGRCRRTDGKKWRCSRDVAPDQKYCERHMHRGRPRSRKPVEVQTQNPTRTTATAATAIAAANATRLPAHLTTTTTVTAAAAANYQPSGFSKAEMTLPFQSMVSAAVAADKEPRFLDQMESDQQWQLMDSKVGLRADCSGSNNGSVLQPFDDHLNLNFTDFSSGVSEAHQNDQCCLYLNTDLSSLEESGPNQKPPPRRFIDAWSVTARDNPNNDHEKSPVSSGGKLSTLTLSMSGGNASDAAEDMDHIQMGLSISESERDNGSVKSQPLSWMNSFPWQTPPSLGGPLGEVLQSSTVAGSSSASPHGCGSSKSSCGGLNLMSDSWGEAASPHDRLPRPDSSPTGVLQKTLASLSDSSSNSSPTFAAAKSEIALQWLSQSKKLSSS